MLQSPQANETMERSDDRLDEIRTICRLHACPTGQTENLIDLPSRLSQDAGLRSDLSDIVRSLQRSNLHLPDVLDLILTAVGGNSLRKHSRELSEPISLLEGFLGNIGRWPSTDSQPILAPGEVPENLHKFLRPQAAAPAPAPPQSPSPLPAEPAAPASRVRLYEAPRGDVPRGDVPRRDVPPREAPLAHAAADATSRQSRDPEPARPELIDSTRVRSTRPDQPAPAQETPSLEAVHLRPVPVPVSQDTPDEPAGSSVVSDIGRALARLERGNLELRAHLDSIDQRISRMEPLLESGTPPDDAHLPDPATAAPPQPTLVHRSSSVRGALRADAIHTPALHPEPIHTDPLIADIGRSDPQDDRPGRRSAPEMPHWPDPSLARTPGPGSPSSTKLSPPDVSPVVPRFSRFSRDPDPVDAPLSLQPEPEPIAHASSQPGEMPPMPLPRGFFGTVPDDGDTAASAIEDPPRRNGRRLTLIAVVVILLALAGLAAFLYTRNVSGDGNQPSGAAQASPAATSTNTSRGPLTATPTQPSATPQANGKVLGARSSYLPRQSAEELGTAGGFRPAGTFVAASVMDGHLISAPLPTQPRVPANSGLRAMVVIEANISNTGQIEDAQVLGGNSNLRYAAIQAVRQWRYKPYLVNGVPTEVRTIIRVDFSQHRSEPAQRSGPFPS